MTLRIVQLIPLGNPKFSKGTGPFCFGRMTLLLVAFPAETCWRLSGPKLTKGSDLPLGIGGSDFG